MADPESPFQEWEVRCGNGSGRELTLTLYFLRAMKAKAKNILWTNSHGLEEAIVKILA